MKCSDWYYFLLFYAEEGAVGAVSAGSTAPRPLPIMRSESQREPHRESQQQRDSHRGLSIRLQSREGNSRRVMQRFLRRTSYPEEEGPTQGADLVHHVVALRAGAMFSGLKGLRHRNYGWMFFFAILTMQSLLNNSAKFADVQQLHGNNLECSHVCLLRKKWESTKCQC